MIMMKAKNDSTFRMCAGKCGSAHTRKFCKLHAMQVP